MKRTGPTNEVLQRTIAELEILGKKQKVPLWTRLAYDLKKPARQRRAVNLLKINKYTQEKEIAVIPGKVLGVGNVSKKLTVAAWDFSASAKTKINKTGKALSLQDLMKQNPKGKGVRIIG